MHDDSLRYLLRAPQLVERAVRRALAESFALRREYRRDCDARSFVKLALGATRSLAGAMLADADELTLHESEAAVVRAAAFFAATPLGKRLRTLPLERIVTAPQGFDLAVRDRRGRLHYVRLETYANTDARLDAVARAVRAMDRTRTGDARASLHFFSLRDGTLRTYPAGIADRTRVPRAAPRVAVRPSQAA